MRYFNRSIFLAMLVLGVAAAACGKQKTEPSAGTPGGEPAAPTETPAKPATPGNLDCARLLPADFLAKSMPGQVVHQGGGLPGETTCYVHGRGKEFSDPTAISAHVDCRPTATLDQFRKTFAGGLEPPQKVALGVEGYVRPSSVAFFDDRAPCEVRIGTFDSAPRDEALLAVARQLDGALQTQDRPAVPKGRFAMSCERMLPKALRDQLFPRAELFAEQLGVDEMGCRLRTKYPPNRTVMVEHMMVIYDCRKDRRLASQVTDLLKNDVCLDDQDTPCTLTVTGAERDHAEVQAMAQQLAKALTLETLR